MLTILLLILSLLTFILKSVSGRRLKVFLPYISVAASFGVLILSIVVVILVLSGGSQYYSYPWIKLNSLSIYVGIYLDKLSALMLFIVALVSFCVQFYSLSYMHHDPRIDYYYAFLSLFAFSMIGLVVSSNLLITFVFWELVGLCSYLLIGFWFERLAAANAAVKALVVTRIGDIGFLFGIAYLLKETGTLDIVELSHLQVAPEIFSLAAILLFIGAVGKSAQFPLHVWLPDAMEGPTPVSALIHAATMVAAGAYLLIRVQYLFAGKDPRVIVLAIGLVTALMAALMAIFQRDIKKVLAFSTISQLGYMMVAIGLGAFSAGMFHLTTHAFFKALLFLAAGSIFHAAHTLDIFKMGGLARKMPLTAILFLVGGLSLAGFPGTGGFFSKDTIIAAAEANGIQWLYYLLLFGAFLTSFYIFRVFFRVFFGKPGEVLEEVHESDWKMHLPMITLAVLSFAASYLAFSNVFAPFASGHVEVKGAVKSGIVSIAGIFLAWIAYGSPRLEIEKIKIRLVQFISDAFYNRLYIDDFYNAVFLGGYQLLSRVSRWFDENVVDGIVRGVGSMSVVAGDRVRRIQNGILQYYLAVSLLIVLLLAYLFLFLGWGAE